MTLSLVKFNTSQGPQPAIADNVDGDGNPLPAGVLNLVVLSTVDVDGMTAGQVSVKTGISGGHEPGTFSH